MGGFGTFGQQGQMSRATAAAIFFVLKLLVLGFGFTFLVDRLFGRSITGSGMFLVIGSLNCSLVLAFSALGWFKAMRSAGYSVRRWEKIATWLAFFGLWTALTFLMMPLSRTVGHYLSLAFGDVVPMIWKMIA